MLRCLIFGHKGEDWNPAFAAVKGPEDRTPLPFQFRECIRCGQLQWRDDPSTTRTPRKAVPVAEIEAWVSAAAADMRTL